MSDDISAGAGSGAAPSSGAPNTASPSPSDGSSSAAPASSAPASPVPGPAPAASEPGPIPYARFKEVNDQLKGLRDFREQHGWVEEFHSNPVPYVEQWLDQLAGHPQYQQQVLAKVARMLASRRGQTVPAQNEEPTPDVPVMDAQGNVMSQTYSAPQLKKWQEWSWQQREAQLSERFAPLEQLKTRLEDMQEKAERSERSHQTAHATLTDLRSDPIFVQHEAAVKQALSEHDEWGDNVHRAYAYVLQTQVLPTFQTTAESKLLGDLKQKAMAGTVSPGVGPATQKPRFKSHGDALRYYAEHPAEAEAMANSR